MTRLTEAKYKATGKKLPLKVLARWATDTEFHDFFNNYLKAKCAWQLAALLEVPDYELELNRELVEHAQNHECFIRRLLEKGYIEEVKISAYDKWVDECPHSDEILPFYKMGLVEWAKRMPKKED